MYKVDSNNLSDRQKAGLHRMKHMPVVKKDSEC